MANYKKLPTAHLVILGALIVVPAARAQAVCDRACLGAIMTRYFNAMVAHDPAAIPVAPTVKFTFEGQPPGGSSGWN
jgi:hypothetical protein